MKTLRLGLVADIHAGVTRSNIKSSDALPLLETAVEEANVRGLDLFVTLGDNVNATSRDEDKRHLREVSAVLARLKAPAVPLFGNNDLKFLSRDEVATALRCAAGSEVREIGGWKLIFWRPACDISLNDGLALDDVDLVWLQDALNAAAYPAVVFLHVPIDGHSMIGNYYFERQMAIASYRNAGAARELIGASGKVVAVFSGHVHWNAGSTIGGIHHRTLASLADTFRTSGEASGAWAILELGSERLTLEVFGREPMTWSAPPRPPREQWLRPLAPDGFRRRMDILWARGCVSS